MDDLYIIKKEIENYNIIEEYFFNFINPKYYHEKAIYFKKYNLVDVTYNEDYYFDLPFNILNRLLQSIENKINTKSILVNNIILSKSIWYIKINL